MTFISLFLGVLYSSKHFFPVIMLWLYVERLGWKIVSEYNVPGALKRLVMIAFCSGVRDLTVDLQKTFLAASEKCGCGQTSLINSDSSIVNGWVWPDLL